MNRERRIGWGILAAVVLIGVLGIGLYLAQEAAALKYTILFKDAQGLQAGDRVQISGVDIGTVQYVQLHTDPTRVDVRVRIEPRHAEKVRADSTAIIRNSTGMVNVSGQMIVEVINSAADPTFPPMQDDATVEGLDGQLDLGAWKLKKTLSETSVDWRRKLDLVAEGLGNRIDEVKQFSTSPQVQSVLQELMDFLKEMREKGQAAAQQLAQKWPELKAKAAPVLKELQDFGREYIANQIRNIMDQIEQTLEQWREAVPASPPSAEPTPVAQTT